MTEYRFCMIKAQSASSPAHSGRSKTTSRNNAWRLIRLDRSWSWPPLIAAIIAARTDKSGLVGPDAYRQDHDR